MTQWRKKSVDEVYGSDDDRWKMVRPLSSIVAARQPRRADEDVTLFKSLGMGISDLSLGIEVYNSAVARGLGQPLTRPQKLVSW